MNKSKILFIVEGKCEKKIYEHLGRLFSLSASYFSFNTDIYALYSRMKKDDFNLDIISLILELPNVSENDKNIIRKEKPFAYIYLIFDLDIQRDLDNFGEYLSKVSEMIKYFNNETDLGKLYVNYPMFEAYRDCKIDDFDSLEERKIFLSEIKEYKKIVNKRGFDKKKGNLKTIKIVNKLISMNVYKANYIVSGTYQKPSAYQNYQQNLSQDNIFKSEKNAILEKKYIWVLNSGLFIILDYFGKIFFEKEIHN